MRATRDGTRTGKSVGRFAVIGVPYVWLLVFFLLPFLIIVKISDSEMGAVSVNDLVTYKDGVLSMSPRLGNYATVARDDLYFDTYFSRDRKSTRLNSSHIQKSRMPSSA